MRLLGEKQFNGFGGFLAQASEEGRGADDPDWYEPLVDPRGVIHCVRVPIAGHKRPKAVLGLVPAQKSTQRYGLKGAAPSARKSIKVTARCLNKYSNRCAFGAFTPCPADMDSIEAAKGGTSGMTRRLGNALTRFLQRRGVTPLWMLVPEITPRRSLEWGRPAIHWHFLAVGKRTRWDKQWFLSKSDWAEVYRTAFRWHTQREPADTSACSRVEMARNPARYLAKYLSKEVGDLEGVDFEGHPDALPRQWQSRSGPLRRLVEFYTHRLPSSFAEFLSQEWKVLEGLKLGYANHWHPPSCDRYEILTFYPHSLEALMLVWERYVSWLPTPSAATGFETPHDPFPGLSTGGTVQVHQESGESVVSGGVGPLKDLLCPDAEQLDLLERCLNKSQVIAL